MSYGKEALNGPCPLERGFQMHHALWEVGFECTLSSGKGAVNAPRPLGRGALSAPCLLGREL